MQRISRRSLLSAAVAAPLAVGVAGPAAAAPSRKDRTPGQPRRATPGQFTTQDGYIYAPNGHLFVPIGANMAMPYSFDNNVDTAIGKSDDVLAWGWNTIRLPILALERMHYDPSPDWYQNMLDAIDKVVREYTRKKIVVIVDNHALFSIDMWMAPILESDIADADRFWRDIATRYRDNPYVWFDLNNELPGDPEFFKSVMNRHIDIVRSIAPTNIIIVGTMGWGQDIDGRSITEPDMGPAFYERAGGNLVIDVHFYGGYDMRITPEQQVEYYRSLRAVGLPLIIGEAGYSYFNDGTRWYAPHRAAALSAMKTASENGVGLLWWNAQHVIGNFSLVWHPATNKPATFSHWDEPGYELSEAGAAFWDLTHDEKGKVIRNPKWLR